MKLSLLMKIKNNQKYNSILTVICHVTKYVLFIFIQNNITAADFVKLFFKHVKCHFRMMKAHNMLLKQQMRECQDCSTETVLDLLINQMHEI